MLRLHGGSGMTVWVEAEVIPCSVEISEADLNAGVADWDLCSDPGV
jgi:hypothetical protein